MIPVDILAYDQINDLAILKADFKPTNVNYLKRGCWHLQEILWLVIHLAIN